MASRITSRATGGEGSLQLLKECGGNSGRLWNVGEDTQSRLDEAHRQGISVAVGIWLEHERLGLIDYADEKLVAQQFDFVIEAVEKFKDHPAVLVWGLGNEMEGYGDGDDPNIWNHVEKLAKKIKEIDPNHPTMTVIAEIGGNKIPAIHEMCPSLDIVGINSYAGAQSIPERYRQAGGTKPYIVTEFGPRGTWEVPKNSIDAIVEETSTEKAETYRQTYLKLKSDSELCLGSYAFLWGNKQEATATWFGLLLPDGKKTAGVDALCELWSGTQPDNICPRISEISLQGSDVLKPGETVEISLQADDPEGQLLNVRWELMAESKEYVTSGDFQETPPTFEENVVESNTNSATVRMPQESGLYRVYAFVDDGAEGGAVANLPLRVKAVVNQDAGQQADLPFIVFDEPGDNATYAPSGWMGSTDAIKVNENCQTDPKFGSHCIECSYSKTDNWGGVVWLSPDGDWGDQPGGLDLTGAKKWTFWARGLNGGEEVKFGFGLLGREKKYFDTGKDELDIQLTKEWKEYSVDLSDKDLSRIKTGFYWTVAGQGKPVTFFVDRIMFDDGSSDSNQMSEAGASDEETTTGTKLPYTLFDEPGAEPIYVASGWMGSTDAISVNEQCQTDPKFGSHCMECKYSKADNWGGVVWLSPDGDWGDQPGGLNLTGAKKMTFWARGSDGEEVVKFGFGLLGPEKKFPDTGKDEMNVTLTNEWKEYTFDLSNKDLSRIKTGFYWTIAGQGKPVTFYIDRIRFE